MIIFRYLDFDGSPFGFRHIFVPREKITLALYLKSVSPAMASFVLILVFSPQSSQVVLLDFKVDPAL